MRIQKAENATFQLASICSVQQSQSIHVIKKLFMAKIIPILLYGSPIWGSVPNNKIHLEDEDAVNKENVINLKMELKQKTLLSHPHI